MPQQRHGERLAFAARHGTSNHCAASQAVWPRPHLDQLAWFAANRSCARRQGRAHRCSRLCLNTLGIAAAAPAICIRARGRPSCSPRAQALPPLLPARARRSDSRPSASTMVMDEEASSCRSIYRGNHTISVAGKQSLSCRRTTPGSLTCCPSKNRTPRLLLNTRFTSGG